MSENDFSENGGYWISKDKQTLFFFFFQLSTMRFGSRMMNVPSEPAITEDFDMLRLCKHHEKEIRTLRQELAMHDTLTNRSQISYEPLSESQIRDVREQVKRFLAGELNDIELVNVRQIKETFAQFRLILNAMQSDMEERLKQKYVLQERQGAIPSKSYNQSVWMRFNFFYHNCS